MHTCLVFSFTSAWALAIYTMLQLDFWFNNVSVLFQVFSALSEWCYTTCSLVNFMLIFKYSQPCSASGLQFIYHCLLAYLVGTNTQLFLNTLSLPDSISGAAISFIPFSKQRSWHHLQFSFSIQPYPVNHLAYCFTSLIPFKSVFSLVTPL